MPFGGTIKLTGESEYRSAIQQITQDLGKMSSALKAQATDFGSSDKSMKDSAQKQKELTETLKAQQTALLKAKSSYAEYSVAVQAQTAKHNALSKEYKNAVLELERIKKASGESSEEYKKQEKVVDELGEELAESTAELNESKAAMSALKSEMNNSQRVIDNTTKEIDELGKETEETGEQAEKAGEGFTVLKVVLANLATQAINSALNGIKKLGAAFVDVGKQAISSYAEYEQLVGGVETLFGDSAGQVEEYANQAYKTAGISANRYMEQVTSFSASLLQGLGGDTAKAAEIGNMAVIDMADNANKMGTDLASIQNAYQGFAKQNYTMLDNLKLGYGGTQEEMARLLNDSGVLGDSVKVTAKTVKDVPFDKIIEGIHVIQENIGITGTTTAEAMETISGSAGSMRAAWQNMLAGMANENADFAQLSANWVNSLVAVVKNVVPRISTVITGIAQTLQTAVPQLIQEIVPIIRENLPIIMQAVEGAISSILSLLPQIMPVISELIPQIVGILLGLMPQLLSAGIEIISSLLDGISSAIPSLLAILPGIIESTARTLVANLPKIINTGISILMSLVNGIVKAIPQLIAMLPTIIQTIINVLTQNLPLIIDAGVKLLVALIGGIVKAIPQLIAMIPQIITAIVTTLANNWPQIVAAGKEILHSLINGIKSMVSTLISSIGQIGTMIINKFGEPVKAIVNVGKNLVRGLWNGINDSVGWVLDKIRGFGSSILSGIKGIFGIASPSKLMRNEVGKYLAQGIGVGFTDEMEKVSAQMQDAIPTGFDTDASINGVSGSRLAGGSNGYVNMVEAFKEALSQMKIELDDDEVGRFIDKTVTRLVYN